MSDNKEYYKVYENEKVTLDMLKEINDLDKKFYKDEYIWDIDYQQKLFNKNKDSIIIVTYNNKVVGYLNYLVITKEKYYQMINSNLTIDEFELDEVTMFYKNKENFLTLNSVVVDKEFQDGYVIHLLTHNFKQFLKEKNLNNYKIVGINSIAISDDGRKFLENLGFKKYKVLNDNNYLYVLDDNQLDNYLK